MALTGNQKAYLQARSNIARSGATRSGYYFAHAIITIDVGGVPQDVSPYVVYNGWELSLNLNDEVDTATIALLPSCPFVPQTRSQVVISLGSGRVFGGLVMTVQRTRHPGPDPRYWYDLTCVDWMAILDAHLVLAEYPAQSATTTIVDLVQRFTRGNISTAGVAPNLPTVPGMVIINERPSTVLRRITNKLGGGFYLDADRILHAWSDTIPSPIQYQPPEPLTDHLPTLKTFRVVEDASQQRTRLWVEGQRTSTLLGVPATSAEDLSIPVTEGHIVLQGDSGSRNKLTRVGSQLGQAFAVFDPTVDPSNNPPGTVTTLAAAAGATVLAVQDSSAFSPVASWAQVAGQTILCNAGTPTTLNVTAAPSTGSLQAPVAAGTQIILLPWMQFDPQDRGFDDVELLPPAPMRAQPEDTPVVLVVRADDAATAASIAVREGSDGFYEHLVQDGRFNFEGASARAAAELADFTQPLVRYEWETEDVHAEPGRMQHIALVEGTPLTADVRITNVTVRPVTSKHPPRRQVTATRVQAAGVVDIWVDDPR